MQRWLHFAAHPESEKLSDSGGGHLVHVQMWSHPSAYTSAEALHFLVCGLCSCGYTLLRARNVRQGM